jgi:hypothetical protein
MLRVGADNVSVTKSRQFDTGLVPPALRTVALTEYEDPGARPENSNWPKQEPKEAEMVFRTPDGGSEQGPAKILAVSVRSKRDAELWTAGPASRN